MQPTVHDFVSNNNPNFHVSLNNRLATTPVRKAFGKAARGQASILQAVNKVQEIWPPNTNDH